MGKGKPFLELLSSAIHGDYRFPFLEVFAFLYTLSAFVLASFTGSQGASSATVAYNVVHSLLSGSLFIFIIVMLKNVAYGLGSDLEKGIIQTYFSYPLKRWLILTAKLCSAIGVSMLLFLGIQISTLYLLAPDIILPHFDIVLLTYITNLSFPLLISAIMLLLTLILRRGGIALVVGIILYFAIGLISGLAIAFTWATESPLALQIISLISPSYVLQYHYSSGVSSYYSTIWTPTFSEVLLYTGASYVIVALVFVLGYVYFSRRLNL